MSAEVEHFSDWSLVTGAQLSPHTATVSPGERAEIKVVVCEYEDADPDDLLAPLAASCRASEVFRGLVKDWSVNGTKGGDAAHGTITVQEDKTAVYAAPSSVPTQNPVAVSTEYTSLAGESVTLIANILVQGGLCAGATPAAPCKFELVAFNGKALPYKDLPREEWENPEQVTAGSLVLDDFDGNGEGRWSLRQVWVEERPVGDLEHFTQSAGEFTTDASGKMLFTVMGYDETFTGSVMDGNTILLEGYPFSTSNATLDAQLTLKR